MFGKKSSCKVVWPPGGGVILRAGEGSTSSPGNTCGAGQLFMIFYWPFDNGNFSIKGNSGSACGFASEILQKYFWHLFFSFFLNCFLNQVLWLCPLLEFFINSNGRRFRISSC